jgi:hypothetical protein
MGAWKPGFASCSNNVEAPAPNPKNFKIKFQKSYSNGTVAIVDYPDCSNYEGRKILVFSGNTPISKDFPLDPHFQEGPNRSPIARFEPSVRGSHLAFELARKL